jgi:hypothetical protein
MARFANERAYLSSGHCFAVRRLAGMIFFFSFLVVLKPV